MEGKKRRDWKEGKEEEMLGEDVGGNGGGIMTPGKG